MFGSVGVPQGSNLDSEKLETSIRTMNPYHHLTDQLRAFDAHEALTCVARCVDYCAACDGGELDVEAIEELICDYH